MARQHVSLQFQVGGRQVTVQAMDSVCVEDILTNLIQCCLHRHLTRESLAEPVGRDVKDFLLKSNLYV